MENITDKLQLSLIKKYKNYLKNCKKKNIDISTSPYCDLNTWHNGVGYEKLLLLKDNKKISLKFIYKSSKKLLILVDLDLKLLCQRKIFFLKEKK